MKPMSIKFGLSLTSSNLNQLLKSADFITPIIHGY